MAHANMLLKSAIGDVDISTLVPYCTHVHTQPTPVQLLVLSVSMYPGLRSIGVQLHSALTGSYVPGHHSVLLVNSPNEQAAKDIGRYSSEPYRGTSYGLHHITLKMKYKKNLETRAFILNDSALIPQRNSSTFCGGNAHICEFNPSAR